jgi:hypothetical protein
MKKLLLITAMLALTGCALLNPFYVYKPNPEDAWAKWVQPDDPKITQADFKKITGQCIYQISLAAVGAPNPVYRPIIPNGSMSNTLDQMQTQSVQSLYNSPPLDTAFLLHKCYFANGLNPKTRHNKIARDRVSKVCPGIDLYDKSDYCFIPASAPNLNDALPVLSKDASLDELMEPDADEEDK